SGYTSLLVSSVISIIAIGLSLIIILLINTIFKISISVDDIIVGFTDITSVLIIFELIKLCLSILTIEKNLDSINMNLDVVDQLKTSSWYFWQSTINFASLLFSSAIFGLSLYAMNGRKNLSKPVLLSVILFFSFYISNIDFFNSL
ncbi:MAG: hypothetical protein ACK54A_01485, partial [Sphingobacteriales bacterium]